MLLRDRVKRSLVFGRAVGQAQKGGIVGAAAEVPTAVSVIPPIGIDARGGSGGAQSIRGLRTAGNTTGIAIPIRILDVSSRSPLWKATLLESG